MAGPFVAQASREQRRLGVLTGASHTAAAATTREQQDGDEFGREQHENQARAPECEARDLINESKAA